MEPDKNRRKSQISDTAGDLNKAGPYINIAYMLIASIAMMGGIGWWLDSVFDLKPALTISGIMAGFFLGMYNLFKMLKKMEKKD